MMPSLVPFACPGTAPSALPTGRVAAATVTAASPAAARQPDRRRRRLERMSVLIASSRHLRVGLVRVALEAQGALGVDPDLGHHAARCAGRTAVARVGVVAVVEEVGVVLRSPRTHE